MRLVVAGNGDRGAVCLEALAQAGHEVLAAVAHQGGEGGPFGRTAARLGLSLLAPAAPEEPGFLDRLRRLRPQATVLAGYGPIVGPSFLAAAGRWCVNLHGGKVPEYRGSSPMNWSLINGERESGISVLLVDERIDAGPVLAEHRFPIGPDDTIADLHAHANKAFPPLLLAALDDLASGCARPRAQDEARAAYWPRRFPDDGLVLWDILTAQQVHDRIRALTDPYPGAFTFLGPRRINLLRSRLTATPHHGDPGRVYRIQGSSLLVAASDRCLWVDRAVDAATGQDAAPGIARYARLATLRGLALERWGTPP